MHALIFRHGPEKVRAGRSFLMELDQVPEVVIQLGASLVGPPKIQVGKAEVVPLLTGYFTGLASNAGAGVDELGDNWSRAYALTFSRLTRKPLYSGVPELGSSTAGLRLFASGPLTLPTKPQWIGIPT